MVIPGSDVQVNHLLYADDTCITALSPAACQHLLNIVQQWLDWAKMRAKPPKSWVLCIKASTGKAYTPHLSIGGEIIQHIGDSPFKFLGMLIRVPPNPSVAKNGLKLSVESMFTNRECVLASFGPFLLRISQFPSLLRRFSHSLLVF